MYSNVTSMNTYSTIYVLIDPFRLYQLTVLPRELKMSIYYYINNSFLWA